jgi:hypothetical protein
MATAISHESFVLGSLSIHVIHTSTHTQACLIIYISQSLPCLNAGATCRAC